MMPMELGLANDTMKMGEDADGARDRSQPPSYPDPSWPELVGHQLGAMMEPPAGFTARDAQDPGNGVEDVAHDVLEVDAERRPNR